MTGMLTGVDSINSGTSNEQGFQGRAFVDPPQTESHIRCDSKGIFAKIYKMRKRIPGIIVTP